MPTLPLGSSRWLSSGTVGLSGGYSLGRDASQITVADSADPAGYDVIVNCTSQGLKADDPMPTDPARVDAGATVVDIIMSREPTPLLRACAERGIAAHAGFEMLVQQVPEYLRFFGHEALAQTLQHDLAEVRTLLRPR